VFFKGVGILLVVVKKGMLKSSIGAVNHNKKQEEEEEVGLPPSSDTKVCLLFSSIFKRNICAPTLLQRQV
jgi:hypothetical protein